VAEKVEKHEDKILSYYRIPMNLLNPNKYSGLIFLIIVFIALFVSSFSSHLYVKAVKFSKEGYSNNNPDNYPNDKPLLADSYKFSGRNTINHNNYNSNWWKKPIFKVGSYSQITNNLRYRKNPDDGTCITPDFCGPLYKDAKVKSNIAKVLPPVQDNPSKKRVNFYNAN